MIGTAVIDAQLESADFDFTSADHWHVRVLCGQAPAARVDLPSPGPVTGRALVEAALLRRADDEQARQALIDRLRHRLGATPAPESRHLTISVVVCTHRRSQYLPDLLASLARLNPAPFEVVVVDNDPGSEDCREQVERAGLRYLREDRRGLDNARNTGLQMARGDIVVFADDDCVVSPGWLAPLTRAFAHESVAAVTGPVFPYVLDTPARVRMEHQASLARGLQRVAFDWQVISPLHASAMGVGANMAIRRKRLLEFGEQPFPPELDAGTETESGGDSYLLSRLLAAGERVVYEPEMFVFHQHRPDGPALRKAVLGYGIGLSAALTKLVVEEHELTAPRAWVWLVKQYLQTQRRRAVGRADAVETRLSWDYLRGGFLGTGRWRQARHTQRAAAANAQLRPDLPVASTTHGASADIEPSAPAAPAQPAASPEVAISVIIPTFRREGALRRCLQALAAQDVEPGSFEVIVVDDDNIEVHSDALDDAIATPAGTTYPFALRRLRSGGCGAAGARNRGALNATAPMLLFLDDDVVADPWLVRRHLQWHAEHGQDAALVGPYRPRPLHGNLAAATARLWWQDMFGLLERARAMTFVGALTANLSLSRRVFDETGGFSEDYSRQRREDWEWGLRMRRAGVVLAFDPGASARHEFTLGTAQRLHDAQREGVGDTLIAARYPEALPSLPLLSVRHPSPRAPLHWIRLHLWRQAAVRRTVVWILDVLELGKLREPWMRVFRLAQSASYALGAHEGGWSHGSAAACASACAPALELELLSTEPVRAPDVAAPLVRVTLRDTEVACVFPLEGVWAPMLAEQIADAMEPEAVARAAMWGGWLTDRRESHEHCHEVEVIFGPANPPSDLTQREELQALGALVSVAQGDAARHWEAVLGLARASSRRLVAFALPGTTPGPAWLAESLSAFDGERVGLVFGGQIDEDEPAEPLYLHDRQSCDTALALVGPTPAYLVLRRELVTELEPSEDLLGPILAALSRALEDDWVIGHRNVRGLRTPTYRARDRGHAYGRLEARTLAKAHGARRRQLLANSVTRGILTLGWQALKQRGRLSGEQRELAGGVTRGAAGTLPGFRKESRG
jgi:glycosyltransferase involved in cell wall biosynthesis